MQSQKTMAGATPAPGRISFRHRCYKWYWKGRDLVVPGLKYSHEIYETTLSDLLDGRPCWLDIGCGHQVFPPWRASQEKHLVQSVPLVVGLDYDHASLVRHGTIRARVRADVEVLPFKDRSFDLVTANMLLEHVREPARLVREAYRVLKPGGRFLVHTPNVWGYGTALARMIPERLKPRIIEWLHGRCNDDVFPAHYRINSDVALRHAAASCGFAGIHVRYLVSDALMIMIPPLAAAELILIRALMMRRLRRLRPYLLAIMEKAPATATTQIPLPRTLDSDSVRGEQVVAGRQ